MTWGNLSCKSLSYKGKKCNGELPLLTRFRTTQNILGMRVRGFPGRFNQGESKQGVCLHLPLLPDCRHKDISHLTTLPYLSAMRGVSAPLNREAE